jgi:hypothetical protein
VIQSYFDKIRKARQERVEQNPSQKDEYDMISSDEEEVETSSPK